MSSWDADLCSKLGSEVRGEDANGKESCLYDCCSINVKSIN